MSGLGEVVQAAGNSRVAVFVVSGKVYALGDCSGGVCGQLGLGQLDKLTEMSFDFADASDAFSAESVSSI